MQFPSMRTDLVRYTIELTWSPVQGQVQLSRRVWTRPVADEVWKLEDIRVSQPLTWNEVEDHARRWCADAVAGLMAAEDGTPPFP